MPNQKNNKLIKNLKYVFEPKAIAIFGASSTTGKIGNVIFKNFLDGGFSGPIYPINPKYDNILGKRCYPSISEVKEAIDCAIFAIPAQFVPDALEECGKAGVKSAIILSGGFGEVGNVEGEKRLVEIARKYEMPVIGPNCLGILHPQSRVDSIFLPMHKLQRPRPGHISFIMQSGAVGSTIIDQAAHYGVGIAKFISYGNAAVLNESDFLEYLANDQQTEQIILYLEGTKDGKALLEQMKKVNPVKPIVALKAGRTGKATAAARSHTGNIAGNYLAYKAAFRQANVIEADSLEELFDFVKIFKQPAPKGRRIAVITNGGGMGVLCADAIEENGLELSDLAEESRKALKEILPPYGNVGNPIDLIADAGAEAYSKSIEICMRDPTVDAIIIVVLFQTPPVDERVITVLVKASDDRRKPTIVVSVGGSYTDVNRTILDSYGVPTYSSPSRAVKAMKKFMDYNLLRTTKR